MLDFNNLHKEFYKPYDVSLNLLSKCGVYQKSISVRFHFMCYVLFYLSLTVFCVNSFHENSMTTSDLAYMASVYLINTQTIFKYTILVSKMKEIIKIIEELGKLWRVDNLLEKQSEMKEKNVKRLNIYNKAIYWINIAGSWDYMLIPLLDGGLQMYTQHKWDNKRFPFSCSFPFDPTQNWATYVTVYVFQVYSMFWMVHAYTASLLLTTTFCAQLSVEFEHLQYDIVNIINMRREEETFKHTMTLRSFVRRHQKLILISEKFNCIFDKMVYADLFFANLTICFFGFSAKVTSDFNGKLINYLAVVSLTLPIYNMCFYGELVHRASSAIAEASYGTAWYTIDKTDQTTLLLILMRSQRPCTLKSFFASVTLNTFSQVLSTTWSYFSLINSLHEDSNQ